MISRLLVFFVLAFVALAGAGIAQDATPPHPDEYQATNACHLLATTILAAGMPGHPSGIAQCNAHPRREECLNTKRYIEQNGKTVPDLTCAGAAAAGPTTRPDSSTPPVPAIAGAVRDSGMACIDLAIKFTTRDVTPTDADIPALVAACNNAKNPCVHTIEEIRRKPRPKDWVAGRTTVSYPLPKGLDCNGYRDPEFARSIKFEPPMKVDEQTAEDA
jgi:hypothetical protein